MGPTGATADATTLASRGGVRGSWIICRWMQGNAFAITCLGNGGMAWNLWSYEMLS